MDTTTPVDGGAGADAQVPEPTQTEAVEAGDQVITNDENGTPSLAPATSSEDEAVEEETESEEPSSEESESTETQATEAPDKTDEEVLEWAEKKGLKVNPDNPNEVRLARMQLETDRKFHEARQIQSQVQPPEELPLSGEDVNYDTIAERLNQQEQINYVRTWFDANPAAKEHKDDLSRIAAARPWLTNMDDVYAHFLANPSREAELRKEGGKQALTNLAQKQQAVPPRANASSGSYESNSITPQNVYDLIDKNDQAWFQKNYAEINKAISGK